MTTMLSRFKADEAGAVTVDWVILTALIVGMAIPVLTLVGDATGTKKKEIADFISSVTVR
ncbi:Flp family type IVb pilin [Aestuariibius insulae]|uniref:Flp family type IVb pilin n=1 Tax=Aestuariibius insulae TaxID=2058287 RepID=UPI00345EBEAE